MVDQPVPKEELRVATNLLLRVGLLLAPDQASRDHLTGIVTAERKRAKKVSEADEDGIIRSLVTAIDQGVTHDNWQR